MLKQKNKLSREIVQIPDCSSCFLLFHLIKYLGLYFCNREQFEMYNKFEFQLLEQSSGVPHRSILGPLFFAIYIHDISINCRSSTLLFAEDLKIFRVLENDNGCILQKDLKFDKVIYFRLEVVRLLKHPAH